MNSIEVKVETRTLASQWLDRSLMYPGKWDFVWVRAPWGWTLVSIEPHAEEEKR